jgi:UDP-glucose 4-epimerase
VKIAVTGALGHIGSALINEIGDSIVAIDNLSSNHHAVLFKQNLKRPLRFVQADILYADLPQLFEDCDIVVHLAAITDAAHSHLNKDEVESVNFIGTEKVGLACAAVGARMIFPSSTSVYGVSGEIVTEESAVHPQSPYAWSKLNAEHALQNTPNLKVSILRFATIYGESAGMRFHTFVNQACWQAVCGSPVEVWSTALDQYRPYLWINDAISVIKHVINSDLFDGEIYNVLTQNATVREVISIIQRYRQTNIKMVDSPMMNQLSYETSCDKINKTGWMPSGNLSDGIREEISLFSRVNNGNSISGL